MRIEATGASRSGGYLVVVRSVCVGLRPAVVGGLLAIVRGLGSKLSRRCARGPGLPALARCVQHPVHASRDNAARQPLAVTKRGG
jgi:hypothetical protein